MQHRLARALRHFFKMQAQETRTRLRANPFAAVSLSHWTHPMTAALAPVLLPLAVRSGRMTLRRLAAHARAKHGQRGGTRQSLALALSGSGGLVRNLSEHPTGIALPGPGNLRAHTLKDLSDPPTVGTGFAVFNSRVVEFIRTWTYAFCDSTNETSQHSVSEAVALLRQELAEGLSRGETAQNLTRRVSKIFHDPARAHAIAQTEVSRTTHGGQFLAAKESGLVRGKRWEASSDACKLCQQMADRGEVPLDEPFAVLPGRGVYSVVMHPPIHPGDMCSMTEVLA